MADLKRMSPQEFRDSGYLLEVNRQFLHPLGLAMAVDLDDENGDSFLVYDDREDPEGWRFGDLSTPEEQAKIAQVAAEVEARRPTREEALGYWVQPTEGP